jgi:adenylate cyclase
LAELTAIGPESYQRWQFPLPEGEVVRLGRAPRNGLKVAWDCKISREHADLLWQDGKLRVECLQTARNPVIVNGTRADRLLLQVGDSFVIGETQFLISESDDHSEEVVEEFSLDQNDPKVDSLAEAGRRLEYVMRLPGIIERTRNDEELAEQLTALLLEALPSVRAAATIRFDNAADLDSGHRPMIRWDSRERDTAPFTPSRRLIRAAVQQAKGVVHFFSREGPAEPKYTVSGDLDWAICTPISTRGPDYWCLYVAGASENLVSHDALKSDLRFTMLMAQLIGSIRQVRQLEKIQAGMSQFFSAAVMETISGEFGPALMAPRVCDITVVFCDVRGFSRMTEDASVDLFPLLERVNAALGLMTQSIVKYDGAIADFQGDAALGFWGWPVMHDEGAVPACQAALAICEGFSRARADRQHPLHGFKVGIGLAHGKAIAGRIGSDEQAKVGVFGPRVNLGSRLEGMTKILNASILMDEATAAQARAGLRPDEGRLRRLGRFRPFGMKNPVEVSELLPPASRRASLTDDQIDRFEAAVDAVATGNWSQAHALFDELPQTDGPRAFYLNLLMRHDQAPPKDWDGIVTLTSK